MDIISTKLLNPKQVIIRITLIIAIFELLIMLLLQASPYQFGVYTEAALDTAILALLSIPAIYFWVIKPFVDARDAALTEISILAITDPLTQLVNRRFIADHLKTVIASSIRYGEHGAVLLIDLDGFKPVNDSHGHETGDTVLITIAERLKSHVRTEDVVGRMGGDEFVVLVHRLDTDKDIARDMALQIAEGLLSSICKPIDISGKELYVGASIGTRLIGLDELDVETAMDEADVAMYQAKESGRGRVVFYEK